MPDPSKLFARHFCIPLAAPGKRHRLVFNPRGGLLTPILDSFILKWRDQKRQPFEVRDVVPQRVGVIGWNETVNEIILCCSAISWAQYILIRDFRIRQQLPHKELFHRLGTSLLIRSLDGKYILSKRQLKTPIWPRAWHISVGGQADLGLALETGRVDGQIYKELLEELGLEENQVGSISELGLFKYNDETDSVMALCFFADSNISSQEILAAARQAKDSHEGRIFAFDRDEIMRLLESESFVPEAAGALLVHFQKCKL